MTSLNLVNKTFGGLKVIKQTKNNKWGMTVWVCECKCGNQQNLVGADLVRRYLVSLEKGFTLSCRRCSKRPHIRHPEFTWIYKSLVRRAKNANIPISFTFDEFCELTKEKSCHYCGANLIWSKHWNDVKNTYAGYNLDRKDRRFGYELNNIVPCCWICNRAKGDSFTYREFLEIGKIIGKVIRHRDSNAGFNIGSNYLRGITENQRKFSAGRIDASQTGKGVDISYV